MTIPCPATSTSSGASLRDEFELLWKTGLLAEYLANQSIHWSDAIHRDWGSFAHDHQRVPLVANNGQPWRTWLILGGRGAGKTRAGAEWVRSLALANDHLADNRIERIALVGETERDTREVMIEGESGILAVHARHDRPKWIPSRRRIEWSNGTVAESFSAEDPESLRGPQFHAAWADELAKWRHPGKAMPGDRAAGSKRGCARGESRERAVTAPAVLRPLFISSRSLSSKSSPIDFLQRRRLTAMVSLPSHLRRPVQSPS
jgi:phage terminase large subunit-like protein